MIPRRVLFVGKVVDVERDVSKGGYTVDRCLLSPLTKDESAGAEVWDKRHMVIPFQNDFLYDAYADENGNESEIICTVPDLISILGEDGETLGSQELRHGWQVVVIGIRRTRCRLVMMRGLKVGSPECFGLGMEWKSIGKYEKPRSLMKDCNQS